MLGKLAIIVMTVNLSAQAVQQESLHLYQDPEAYKVYSVLLESSSKHAFMIQEETVSLVVNVNLMKQQLKKLGVTTSVVDDFAGKNNFIWRLDRHFNFTQEYTLLDSKSRHEMFDDFFSPFYQQRYFAFSPVGFNIEKTSAIVAIVDMVNCGQYFLSSCKSAGGSGRFVALRKEHGSWKEIDCGKQCLNIAAGEF